jgi:hypothetical protein
VSSRSRACPPKRIPACYSKSFFLQSLGQPGLAFVTGMLRCFAVQLEGSF